MVSTQVLFNDNVANPEAHMEVFDKWLLGGLVDLFDKLKVLSFILNGNTKPNYQTAPFVQIKSYRNLPKIISMLKLTTSLNIRFFLGCLIQYTLIIRNFDIKFSEGCN